MCRLCDEGYDGEFCREYGITFGEWFVHICDESRPIAEENKRAAEAHADLAVAH